ncbi:MAG: type VII secretion protein EccCa [Candidatus Dormibacteraeota bacterium]|uniref:Type VII secretion protein EccCa n=1 Tax=Candidatus Amunia macphersoniae TaxID=3127014 RepID=A0A934KEZ7_9BACT|nr:type VII secretion protein EccCa [Candidatus Dormibacteraeota bacterium]
MEAANVDGRARAAEGARAPTGESSAGYGLQLHRPARVWPVGPPDTPIGLAAPPTPPEAEEGGAWMSLLPMVGSLSIIAFAFVVRSLVYIIVIAAMVLAMVAASLGTRVVQTRSRARRWQLVQARYRRHLGDVEARAAAAAELQGAGLAGLYPNTAALLSLVRSGDGVWERRPTDQDFAAVRLGLGEVAATCPVAPEAPVTPLAQPDPELAEAAEEVTRRYRSLPAAPVMLPLRRLGVLAVVGPRPRARDLVGSWVASLAAGHALGELRLIGYVPVDSEDAWDWVKWLPHTRDPRGGDDFGRARRAFTTDLDVFAEQVRLLVRPRMEARRRAGETGALGGAGPVHEHVVVVIDGYEPGGPVAAIRDLEPLMAEAGLIDASVVVLVDEENQVPATCGARVDLGAVGTASYRESGPGGHAQQGVAVDELDRADAEELARLLAPLQLADGHTGGDLVDSLRLVELLGVEHAEAFDTATGWLTVPAVVAGRRGELLRVPIGRADDGEPLVLDLKEAAAGGAGPHGILVGATGSGKSELLRSLVIALAAQHDPGLLNVVLVDFKGGAAFAELAGLPHVCGLVTNLADDLSLVDRMQQALAGELERRQQLLSDVGNLDSIGGYHNLLAEGADLPALPFLVVVVDEFGELLVARPEFLDTFIALGRLGRSLGIHLLLASQRLDEGRIRGLEPHLRYRICLRTNTSGESSAVLGSPAAFQLPAIPGLGYLQVDRELTRFKVGLVTLPYQRPQPLDHSRLMTETMRPFTLGSAFADEKLASTDDGRGESDLNVLVARLAAAAHGRDAAHRVWLDPLPDQLTLGDVRARCDRARGAGREGGSMQAALGLVDLPLRQDQAPLVVDLSAGGGNLAVAGAPRTGKSTLLRTLVVDLASRHGPDEVQFYCLDLGGGGLFTLADLPHVGAMVGRGEVEMTARLLREMRALIDERAAAFRDQEVTSLADHRRALSGAGGPSVGAADVFLLVDGIGLLRSTMPEDETLVGEIASSGLQYGVHVVLAANRWLDIRPALLDAIGTRLEFHLGEASDSQVGREAARAVPADRPGRGLVRSGDTFQAALPVTADAAWPAGERAVVDDLARTCHSRYPGLQAPRVTALPATVSPGDVDRLATAAGSTAPDPAGGFLLGVAEFRSQPVQIDLLAAGAHLLVLGDGASGRTTLLRRALAHLLERHGRGQVEIHIVDLARGLVDLAESPQVTHYAATTTAAEKIAIDLAAEISARTPPDALTPAQLRGGGWWDGPQHFLVVDDYDLTLTQAGGPLGALVDCLPLALDTGLHVLLTRRVAGASRTAFEPFTQRLRELGPVALLLSGDVAEGPLVGGVTARPQPPGRGYLVRPGHAPMLVQLCNEPGPPPADELRRTAPADQAVPGGAPAVSTSRQAGVGFE